MNSGTEFRFESQRDFGAPKNHHVIMFFGKTEWAMIDAGSNAEVIG